MVIKKQIDTDCIKALEELEKQRIEIKTKKDLKNIATVSMESEEYGELLADTFWKIGKDGIVTVEDSGEFTIESDIVTGLEIMNGFSSAYMTNNQDGTCIFTGANILVTNQQIGSLEQIKPITNKLFAKTKQLVIFADTIDKNVISDLVVNKINGVFHALVIKLPVGRKDILEDIASVTGAEFYDVDKGMDIVNIAVEELGLCEKITTDKDKTLIVGGAGNTKDHIKSLKAQIEQSKSVFDKENLEKRIAKISGGVAVIRVGAISESEREYLKLKIEDAVNATKWAFKDGYVKGGGIALKNVAEKMKTSILYNALKRPYEKIQENAGGELNIPDTVIDPFKVVSQALKSACSTARVWIFGWKKNVRVYNETELYQMAFFAIKHLSGITWLFLRYSSYLDKVINRR
jgi:chaperonin GroEL